MLIRIAIVDDQPEARELLRQDLVGARACPAQASPVLTAASPF